MTTRTLHCAFTLVCIGSILHANPVPNSLPTDSLIVDCAFSGKIISSTYSYPHNVNRPVNYKIRFTIKPTVDNSTLFLPITGDTTMEYHWYLLSASFTRYDGMPMAYPSTPPDTSQHIDLNIHPYDYRTTLLRDIPTRMPARAVREVSSFCQIAKDDTLADDFLVWYDPSRINNDGGGIPGGAFQWYGSTSSYSPLLYTLSLFCRYIEEDYLDTISQTAYHILRYSEFRLSNASNSHLIAVGDTFYTSVRYVGSSTLGRSSGQATAQVKLTSLTQVYPPLTYIRALPLNSMRVVRSTIAPPFLLFDLAGRLQSKSHGGKKHGPAIILKHDCSRMLR